MTSSTDRIDECIRKIILASRQPDYIVCNPGFYEAYLRTVDAPLWKKMYWKIRYSDFVSWLVGDDEC
jgi:hypothetical protein